MRELTSFEKRESIERRLRKVEDLKNASVYLQHQGELADGEMVDYVRFEDGVFLVGTAKQLKRIDVDRLYRLLDFSQLATDTLHEFHARRNQLHFPGH